MSLHSTKKCFFYTTFENIYYFIFLPETGKKGLTMAVERYIL